MKNQKYTPSSFGLLLLVAVMVLIGCTPSAAPTEVPTPVPTQASAPAAQALLEESDTLSESDSP